MKQTKKDITYYSLMFGGCPMTREGAKRFLIAAQTAGYNLKECLEYIPNELLSDSALITKGC